MKLSIETHVLREYFSDETAVRMIKQAGFDAFDYSFYWVSDRTDMLGNNYREKASALRKVADEIGIECNQAHAPFDFDGSDTMNLANINYLRLVRSIEAASILGAKNIIVHAIHKNLPPDIDFYEYNRCFYSSLIPYCEKYNICVSVENLFKRERKLIPVFGDTKDHIDFVKSLNSSWLNICIDVGHSGVTGVKPEVVIRNMDPTLLKALHIQDNDYKEDLHLLPYLGNYDWDAIMQALAEIGYTGDFTYEIFGFTQRQDIDNLPAALKFAEQTGRNLIRKFYDSNHM